MSRREDFYKTLNHEKPEKLILDLGGCPLSSMEGRSKDYLMEYLGIDYSHGNEEDREYARTNKLDERLLKYLDIDTRSVGSLLTPQKSLYRVISDSEYIDGWGIRRKYTGKYWDIIEHPLRGASVDDLDSYTWPEPGSIDIKQLELYRADARRLYQETDYIICAEHPVYGIFELGCWMCGFDDFLIKMAMDVDFIKKFFEIILGYQKNIIEIYYGMLGEFIHYTSSGDDFATQASSFISPNMFNDLIKPYLQERIKFTKKFTKASFLHHSCGNIYHIIPHLIDAGVDILNPIQPVNEEMSAQCLKASYGDRIVFHGGVDTQQILPFGTEESIREEVGRVIEVISENGGYIFAAAHNIQEDVPPQNIIAMFKAARDLYRV